MASDGEGAGGAGGGDGGASAAFFGGDAGGAGDQSGAGAGAGGGAGAGDQGGAGAGAGDQGGGADPEWFGQLPAEAEGDSPSLRDWAKAAGVKDIAGLAKMARDNMTALRESGRVKIPGADAKPEEVAAWHKAIGVPDAPEGYELRGPVGEDGKPVPLNEALLGPLAASAHKLGIPKTALEGLVQDFVKAQQDQIFAADTAQQQAAKDWLKAQGAEATAKVAAVDRAAEVLGLDRNDMMALRAALGAEKALPMLARIGEGLGEDRFVDGGRVRFGVSGAQAQVELDRLKADPAWNIKATKPGTPENAQYNRLVAAIGEEEERKRRAAA